MSVVGIQSFQYVEFRPLDYRKSFFSLARYRYTLIRSLTLLMVDYSPRIAINFNIPIGFGVFDLDYVLLFSLSHMTPFGRSCKGNE